MNDRKVIVHGDNWPVVIAVAHLAKSALPESDCETTHTLPALLKQLSWQPETTLILCLRPREHIFLFYALKRVLLSHPVMVISDELMFSDRLVLKLFGDIPVILHEKTSGTQQNGEGRDGPPGQLKSALADFLFSPEPVTGFSEVSRIFNNPKRLMNYMSVLMFRETLAHGVTPAQCRLLEEIYKGRGKLSELSGRLKTGDKKIWQEKKRLLVKLGMQCRLREQLYGTRFCIDIQKTAFMTPAEVDNLTGVCDEPFYYRVR
ncbi:TPA: transcriptional regulator [Salmonella enterica]|nr:transcriptional regulator [Salmonella enterica subsp. enterica]HCL5312892.1 transcriptional regulator [Salmonella enterica]